MTSLLGVGQNKCTCLYIATLRQQRIQRVLAFALNDNSKPTIIKLRAGLNYWNEEKMKYGFYLDLDEVVKKLPKKGFYSNWKE